MRRWEEEKELIELCSPSVKVKYEQQAEEVQIGKR